MDLKPLFVIFCFFKAAHPKGLELNVAHTSYQEEEGQSLTLDWTFTPRPDPSLRYLFIFCYMFSEGKEFVLIDFQEGVVYSKSQSEEFSGRVQFDKDLLKEGRIRLNVSSLRTQDSGEYGCTVHLFSERNSDRCRLNVTAEMNEGGHTDQHLNKTDVPKKGSQTGITIGAVVVGVVGIAILAVIIIFTVLGFKHKRQENNPAQRMSTETVTMNPNECEQQATETV